MREHKYDTLRFFLILCTVFGHLIEKMPGLINYYTYRLIYLFHMPAFIFVSGYFASFKPRKILNWIYTYIIYQTLYFVFYRFVLLRTDVSFQYTTPTWLLWYLFVMIFYHLLLPLLDRRKVALQLAFFCSSMAFSLYVSRFSALGYPYSLSRFFTFLPYFIAGFYTRKNLPALKSMWNRIPFRFLFDISVLIVCLFVSRFLVTWETLDTKVLYGSYSYASMHYGPPSKLLIYICGFLWIYLLIRFTPPRRIPIISQAGRYSMPVYLLHGFIVKWVNATGRIATACPPVFRMLYCAVAAFILSIGLGNSLVNRSISLTTDGRWLINRLKKHVPSKH